jgi:tRNA nucleotidyltransferase (CCA-adding enzyme)
MSEEFEAVVDRVSERVTPDPDERDELRETTERLVERTEAAVADVPVEADVLLVGSTARGTWLAGDRDVDLFVRFPPDVERADLESYGLAVGRAVLPDGHEEYAEHPYIVGEFEGFTVDLVPCYDVADATAIQSAVDRTPFHTASLADRLDDETAREVRVAKAFLKGIGVYGSNLKTRGFSGYLTELLVLEYGDFRSFVSAAPEWHPPVELDPADHGDAAFEDPLVVFDPTDPERNVAAALSETNVARLQHYARDLLADPRLSLFEPADPTPLTPADVRAALTDRGTTPVALRFDAPDVVDDQLWPQLEKSLEGVAGELDRRGFDVLRADAFADEAAVLFVELSVATRPAVARHEGPPVHVSDHATGFYERYAEEGTPTAGDDGDATDDEGSAREFDAPYGPFIEDDSYVVERDREYTTALAFLQSEAVFDVALGSDVASAMAADYEVLVGEDVASLCPTFGTELARYFSPKP